MLDTLEKYQALVPQNDLFQYWNTELSLRQQAHHLVHTQQLSISTEESCDFLYRSWYFTGRRYDFFSVLFAGLHDNAVLTWLRNRPANLLEEFLHFLAWTISVQPVKPEKILFLINLFNRDLQENFEQVFHVLDLEQCRYLLVRTANPHFRLLLKQREERILAAEPYCLQTQNSQSSRPQMTIHGEKGLLLQDAAQKIDLAIRGRWADPAGPEHFIAMLDACDQVFKCGLVEDALLMLASLYRKYQEKNRLVDILADRRIFKYFSQLARIMVPIAVLLTSTYDVFNRANAVWEENFPLLSRDIESMHYLVLYESIARGLKGHEEHALWEVLYQSTMITRSRCQDRGPLMEADLTTNLNPGRIQEWVVLARQRLVSRPHEAFTLLELLRLLHQRGRIPDENFPAQDILEMYLDLWNWLPSSLFVNAGLANHLASRVEIPLRRHIQRLLETMEQYREGRLKQELQSRPNLFRQKDGHLQRQVLLGHVLGVQE